MKEKRAIISFWITVVSFIGSVLFIVNIIFFGGNQNKECKECMEKALYYQHKSDSLQNKLNALSTEHH
jgi:hypothetical protein